MHHKFTQLGFILMIAFLPYKGYTTGEYGRPLMKKYTSKDYQYHGQTWASAQAPNGYMFFAHSKGILQFNGERWRLIRLPDNNLARSLATTDGARIYTGGFNEVGFLEPDDKGIYQYHSITRSEEWQFKDVHSIKTYDGFTYFRTSNGILRYNPSDSSLKISSIKGYSRILNFDGELYVMIFQRGIYKLNDELFSENPEPFYATKRYFFYNAMGYPGKYSLVFDYKKGFLLFDISNQETKKWNNQLENLTEVNYLYRSIRLRNGNYAMITGDKGVFILNDKGSIVHCLNKNNFFYENIILNLYEDNHKNLWFNTNNGVILARMQSPFTILDQKYGLQGYPNFSFIRNNKLTTGTTSGLFSQNFDDLNKVPVQPLQGEFNNIIISEHHNAGESVFISSADATFELNSRDTVMDIAVNCFHQPPYDSSIVLSGSKNGMNKIYQVNGKWKSKKIAGFDKSITSLYSLQPRKIWVKQRKGQLTFLHLDKSLSTVLSQKEIDTAYGIPHDMTMTLHPWEGTFLLSTSRGFYKYHPSLKKFTAFDSINQFTEQRQIHVFRKSPDNKYWFWSIGENSWGGYLGFLFNGTVNDSSTFRELREYEINDIDFYENYVIFTAKTKLIFFDASQRPQQYPHKTHITRITEGADEALLIGNPKLTKKKELKLTHNQNSLHFHVSNDHYNATNDRHYSYKLSPFDENWSSWTSRNIKEYTSLPPGNYTFQVKSKDLSGQSSNVESFMFEIASPWYLKTWAILTGVFFLFILAGVIIWLTRRKNRAEKENLERIISERTKELMAQKEELEKEKNVINELNQTKDKFFSIIAHDLRTPFNSMLGLSEILTEDYDEMTEKERKELVLNIHKSTRFSFDLLDNLLTWSRVQRNKIVPNKDVHDLKELSDETLNLLQSAILNKNISTKNKIKPGAKAYCDRNMIITVLRNLISNAVKFTEREGLIEVNAQEYETEIHVSVSDNGVGMSAHDKEKLFDVGKQSKQKGTEDETGTGLGLILSKDFVHQNNGEIFVESELNKGSTFTFTLPRFQENGSH